MTKKEIRKTYLQKRESLNAAERMKLDDLLLIQLQQIYFGNIQLLFTYMPMEHKMEPNTELFARYMFHLHPGLEIAYPVTDLKSATMQAFVVNDDTDYATNSFGITEPVNGIQIEPEMIDVVFVPMLACDKKGFRVGFGKGIYDRYLQHCKPDAFKVGFSYFDPVERIEDAQSFDIPLTHCVTPHCIYEF